MQSKLHMKDFVLDLLNKNLSEFLFYHDPEHTLYVIDKVTEIGTDENCTEAEMDLLRTAALWHDTGYIKTYEGHEEESCSAISPLACQCRRRDSGLPPRPAPTAYPLPGLNRQRSNAPTGPNR